MNPLGLQYGALPPGAIRLLRIGPGGLALGAVLLEGKPVFYAVSHCWGTAAPDCPLRVGDQTLMIRPNLAAGVSRLRELAATGPGDEPRLDPAPRRVWIDTICINQDDVDERSSQVSLMGEVYSSSVRTLIWLGPQVPRGGFASAWRLLDLAYTIAETQHPEIAKEEGGHFSMPAQMFSDAGRAASGLPPLEDEAWRELQSVERLPWFSRLWVIQEVALSPRDPLIICGRGGHSWHRFSWAFEWLYRKGYLRQLQQKITMEKVTIMSLIRRWHPNWSLDALVFATCHMFQTADPRDKVYGLIGLLNRSPGIPGVVVPLPIEGLPGYSETDVASTIYQKVARSLIEARGSLALMADSGLGTSGMENQEGLPSWVPDWGGLRPRRSRLMHSFTALYFPAHRGSPALGYIDEFRAAAELGAKIHPTEDEATLRVSGMRVDEVVHVAALLPEASDWTEFSEGLATAMMRACQTCLPLLFAGGEAAWAEKLIRATTAGQGTYWHVGEMEYVQDGSSYLSSLLASTSSTAGEPFRPPNGLIESLRELSVGGSSERYRAIATTVCFNRSFFTTAAGQMGIGPLGVRPGDTVSVILGGGVPYILRKYEGSDAWALIGEAYVTGYMDGEGVAGFPEVIFDLR